MASRRGSRASTGSSPGTTFRFSENFRTVRSRSSTSILRSTPAGFGRAHEFGQLGRKKEIGPAFAAGAIGPCRKADAASSMSTMTFAFLEPCLEARRLLSREGTLYFHIDYREVHCCKVLLDALFGRDCFLNEVIWAYDYGGCPRDRWPPKHDNILIYAKNPGSHIFNSDEIERIPYLAPGLVGKEKAAQGKLPTDTWWRTIVPTRGKERTGYYSKAARDSERDGPGFLAAGRRGPRLFRGKRNDRRRSPRAGSKVYPDGQQRRSPGGHGTPVRSSRRNRVDRVGSHTLPVGAEAALPSSFASSKCHGARRTSEPVGSARLGSAHLTLGDERLIPASSPERFFRTAA